MPSTAKQQEQRSIAQACPSLVIRVVNNTGKIVDGQRVNMHTLMDKRMHDFKI